MNTTYLDKYLGKKETSNNSHFIGLNDWAKDFISNLEIKKLDGEKRYLYSNPFSSSKNRVLGVFYDETKQMKIYEKVEADHWFGCNLVFTCLVYEDGTFIEQSKWIYEKDGFYYLTYKGSHVVFLNTKPFTWEPNTGMLA